MLHIFIVASNYTGITTLKLNRIDVIFLLFSLYIYVYFIIFGEPDKKLFFSYIIFVILPYISGRFIPSNVTHDLAKKLLITGVMICLSIVFIGFHQGFIFENNRLNIPGSDNPILLGQSMLIVIATIIYFLVDNYKTLHVPYKIIIFSTLLLALSHLLFSGSKQSVIGLFLLLCIYGVYMIKHLGVKIPVNYIVLFFIVVVLFGYASNLDALKDSFINIFNSGSTNSRVYLMQSSFRVFMESPIFGQGPNYISWAHNLFLDVATVFGIIGLILFVGFSLPFILDFIGMQFKYDVEYRLDLMFLHTLFIVFFVNALVSGQLYTSYGFMALLGILNRYKIDENRVPKCPSLSQ